MVCNPREWYGSQTYKGFAHAECHAWLSALLYFFSACPVRRFLAVTFLRYHLVLYKLIFHYFIAR